MKYFISVDCEGVSGIARWDEISRKEPKWFKTAQKRVTKEVNSIIEGIKEADKNTATITVCDSHSLGLNIDIDELDSSAELIRGTPRPLYMISGLDETYDMLLFVGYHARVGSHPAFMDHSYSSGAVYRLKINDREVGEAELNAGASGHYEVPLGLVSGDTTFCEEINELYPQVVGVPTKEAITRFAGRMYPIDRVLEDLKDGAKRAVENIEDMPIIAYDYPAQVEIELLNTLMTEVASWVPGVEKTHSRGIRFTAEDFIDLYQTFLVTISMAYYGR
jgi:D-amino peptidase